MSDGEKLLVKRLSNTATIPKRSRPGDAGLDIYADFGGEGRTQVIAPWRRSMISTGVSMMTPAGTYGRVAPRSGNAVKAGIDVLAGVCDSTYRGEYVVCLMNLTDRDFVVEHGDRIAQIVLERISLADAEEVDELPDTERGDGGFGSSGQ